VPDVISKPLLALSSCHAVAGLQTSEVATSEVAVVKTGTEHTIAVVEVPRIVMGHFHVQLPAALENFDSSVSPPLPDVHHPNIQ
jgi:hypothetical protein